MTDLETLSYSQFGSIMTRRGAPVRLPLSALEARELECLYGADAELDGDDAVLTATGPSFHAWRLTNG